MRLIQKECPASIMHISMLCVGFILKALQDNGKGNFYPIDLPDA